MELKLNIKKIGTAYGTSGWMLKQFENGELLLEESNNWYIPEWNRSSTTEKVQTHGLILCDKAHKHGALIAYRDMDGNYIYDVTTALGDNPVAHWSIALTEAAKNVLIHACQKWCEECMEKS